MKLYELPNCPYCQQVKAKLKELGLNYQSIVVPVSHGERTEVKEVSGQTYVPVLVDGQTILDDENDIIAYLEEKYS